MGTMKDDGTVKTVEPRAEEEPSTAGQPSQWRGFITESKSFMDYGIYIHKWKFWLRFPMAAFRFYRMYLIDWYLRQRGYYRGLWH